MTAGERERREQPDTLWTVRRDVAVSQGEDRVVILPLAPLDSAPMELAGAGLEIWRLLDGAHTVVQLVDDLSSRFGADRAAVQHDVERFLDQLEAAHVIEVAAQAAPDS